MYFNEHFFDHLFDDTTWHVTARDPLSLELRRNSDGEVLVVHNYSFSVYADEVIHPPEGFTLDFPV